MSRTPSRAHRRRRAGARPAQAGEPLHPGGRSCDGFLDAGNAATLAAQHLVDQGSTARSWRPSTSTRSTTTAPADRPCPSSATTTRRTTRRAWSCGCSRDAAGTPYLLLHRPRARHPLGGLRPRGPPRRRALRRHAASSAWARCRWRCRTRARSRSPSTPTAPSLLHRRQPVARASSGSRPAPRRCWRCGWRDRGHDTIGLRRARPALPRPVRLPAGGGRAARGRRATRRGLSFDLDGAQVAAEDQEARDRRATSTTNDEVAAVVAGARAAVRRVPARRGVRPAACSPRTSRCRPARRSASRSSGSSPASTAPTTSRTERHRDAQLPPRSSSSCSTSRTSTSNLFRGRQPDTEPQRVFGGQVAAQALIAGGPHRRPEVRRALAALLLPAPRRHRRADRLRRRAPARRPLLRHPAGGGPPARPADLLPDRQLPGARGGLRAPGRDARGRRRRRTGRRLAELFRAAATRGRAVGAGVGGARRPLPRQLRGRRAAGGPDAPRPGAAVDPGERPASPTTRSSTSRRSPTPAT